jgi:hypothetical protein
MFSREYFKRSHEKVIYSDSQFILGSANIGEDYAWRKYGTSFFWDMNLYAKNTCLDQIRSYLVKNANYHNITLSRDPAESNEAYISSLSNKYKDSHYNTSQGNKIILAIQPEQLEIQST